MIYDQLRANRLGSVKVGKRRIITRQQIALIIHGGLAVDCRSSRATLWILILGSGYYKSPADGQAAGVPRAPGGSFRARWDGLVLVRGRAAGR
jgi:hypothetical protein